VQGEKTHFPREKSVDFSPLPSSPLAARRVSRPAILRKRENGGCRKIARVERRLDLMHVCHNMLA